MSDLMPAAETKKRAHLRYEVSIPVDCTTRDAFVSNHVSNISKGGLFLRSSTPLPLNAEVSLVIHLPGAGRSIEAKGRVVWNYDIPRGSSRIVPGSGIRFVDMPASDRAALEDYLADLTPVVVELPRQH